MEDEKLLLAVLNSAPVVEGRLTDELRSPAAGEFARSLGGSGSARELDQLGRARSVLHSVIRNGDPGAVKQLGKVLDGAVLAPQVTSTGLSWELRAASDDRLAVRAVMAWSAVTALLPGRVRACANSECNLFLIDHSRPGTAKWCSMATCGNRMKARASRARLT